MDNQNIFLGLSKVLFSSINNLSLINKLSFVLMEKAVSKKMVVGTIALIIGAIICVGFFFPENLSFLNFFVLVLTLLVLCIYTYDTNRMANKVEEDSIKPIILREGFLDWNIYTLEKLETNHGLKPNLHFTNIKNVALKISGFITINNKRYELLFANDVTTKQIGTNVQTLIFLKVWSWLPENGFLMASYDSSKSSDVNNRNVIEISYFDIRGNKYLMIENENYEQKIEKLKH